MRCDNCGRRIKDGQNFCRHCGAPVIRAGGPVVNKCPQCGAMSDPENRFCAFCGSVLGETSLAGGAAIEVGEEHLSKMEIAKGPSQKWIIILVGCTALLLIAISGFIWKTAYAPDRIKGNKENSSTATAEPSLPDSPFYIQTEPPAAENTEPEVPNTVYSEETAAEAEPLPIAEDIDAPEAQSKDLSAEEVFIIPDSNSRYLDRDDVAFLSLQEINYAKNEIYARHGRKFKSKELSDYFNSKAWYVGRYDAELFDELYAPQLNEYEIANAYFLQSIEFEINSEGYQLDR